MNHILTVDASSKNRSADVVYQFLLSQLMELKIQPGSRIPIDRLARQFGVSQTPIREALSRLEAKGLVIKRHLSGYRAAHLLTTSTLDELFEIRLLLEPYAVSRCVHLLTDNEVNRLRETESQMRDLISNTSTVNIASSYAEIDSVFHAIIYQGCGNSILSENLARLHVHTHLFRLLYLDKQTLHVIEEHRKITNAIIDKNPAHAADAMKEHLQKSYDRFRLNFPNVSPAVALEFPTVR